MWITLNGKKMEYDANLSVAELVEQLSLDTRRIAIERNLEIVPRTQYQATQLQDNDVIEIVQFVGGG